MKQSNDLFELIGSLNKNEKRYFRLYAMMQKGKKNYTRLFDAIEKKRVKNEPELKEYFSGDKILKQIAFTKHYLYRLIIKSLAASKADSNVDSRIHMLITECRILFNREMYRRYFKTIAKAKTLCIKHERYGYLLQILDMEKIIIKKEELQPGKPESIFSEAADAIDKMKNTFRYSLLAGRLLYHYRTYGSARGPEQDNFVKSVLNEPEMKSINKALCSRSKESYYRVRELTRFIGADHGNILKELENRYATVKKNPEAFKDYIINYELDILYSLAENCISLNRFREAEKYIAEINAVNRKFFPGENTINVFETFAKFRIELKKNEFKKAPRFIPLLEKILEKYKGKLLLDTELSIIYYIIICRIFENNFTEALKWANIFMNHPLRDKRGDLLAFVKILLLIIHFELKHFDLLKHITLSAYRFLYKREKLYRLEQLILNFLRTLGNVKTGDDLVYILGVFRKKLAVLKKNRYEKNAFEYFDFIKWIDIKIKQGATPLKKLF